MENPGKSWKYHGKFTQNVVKFLQLHWESLMNISSQFVDTFHWFTYWHGRTECQLEIPGAISEWTKKKFKCHIVTFGRNVGSCGLHVVNGAFQDGAKASGWEIDKLLSSAYWLFKDTPARREDFTTVTKASEFPMKFCKYRWLENVPVCERFIKMLRDLRQYVKAVKEGTVPDPKTKSYETIKQCCANHLVPVRLAFFLSVSEKITRFLTQYQTDKPMLPFMCSDLFKVVKDLMGRFMKSDKMAGVTSVYQSCVKMLLLLSHGQANVERGFSVNKQVELDNLGEDTFVAKHTLSVTMLPLSVACRTLMPATSSCCWQPLLPDRSTLPIWRMKRRKRRVV